MWNTTAQGQDPQQTWRTPVMVLREGGEVHRVPRAQEVTR